MDKSFRFLTLDEYKALPPDAQQTYLFAAIDQLDASYTDAELKARLQADTADDSSEKT